MAKTPIELANKFNKPAPKGLGYDFRDRKASTANHNKIIDEINAKYGNDKLSKKEYWDAIDREVDRWNNEQQYWYEHEDTPYDKDVANQQAERRKGIFDDYGLITDKGRSYLKDFLTNKNLTTEQIMKLNNADFNNLAKEVQQKYGIDNFDLAQEFLVSKLK